MRRKRLKHFADVFCDMLIGWRLSDDDVGSLLAYPGELKLDLLADKTYYNGSEVSIDLYIQKEIRAWFIHNLEKERIDIVSILEAYTIVENKTAEERCKKSSRTRKKVNIDVRIIGYIKTDEKEYITEKYKDDIFNYL